MVIEYGWPLPKRQMLFKDIETQQKRYDENVEFMGKECVLPVWRVPIGVPKYRLLNGRTSSLQQEWIADHPDKTMSYFTEDPERDETQKTQHELLKKLINEAELLKYFEDGEKKQAEPIYLDHLGFVINGNRRLCTWRELFSKNPEKYKHFEYIDIVILPAAPDKAIDELEAHLQIEKDIRADYSWHALANMLLDRMELHKLDKHQLSRLYELPEKRIDELLDMRSYAIEYLKSRTDEGKWSKVDDMEYAFQVMVKKRKQIVKLGDKKIFEMCVYALLDNPEGGRLYEYIPDLSKYQDEVQRKLLAEFSVSKPAPAGEDLLGTDPNELVKMELAEKVNNDVNREKAREIIKDTIETRRLVDKEKDSANYVLKQLQNASTAIQSALLGMRPEATKKGAGDVISSIEHGLEEIKKWLEK